MANETGHLLLKFTCPLGFFFGAGGWAAVSDCLQGHFLEKYVFPTCDQIEFSSNGRPCSTHASECAEGKCTNGWCGAGTPKNSGQDCSAEWEGGAGLPGGGGIPLSFPLCKEESLNPSFPHPFPKKRYISATCRSLGTPDADVYGSCERDERDCTRCGYCALGTGECLLQEGCTNCTPNEEQGCDSGGLGICTDGTTTCDGDGSGFGPCLTNRPPELELCGDTLDSDCDGDADPAEAECCTPTEPGIELTCDDGLDNDCDGDTDATDEDCPANTHFAYVINKDPATGNKRLTAFGADDHIERFSHRLPSTSTEEIEIMPDGLRAYVNQYDGAGFRRHRIYRLDLVTGALVGLDIDTIGYLGVPLALSHDGAQLASAGGNARVVKVLDTSTDLPIRSLTTDGTPRKLAFDSRGERLFAAVTELFPYPKFVKIYDLVGTDPVVELSLPYSPGEMAIHPSETHAYISGFSESHFLRLDLDAGGILTFPGPQNRTMAFNADGSKLFAGVEEGFVRAFDSAGSVTASDIPVDMTPQVMKLHPNGKHLWVGGHSRSGGLGNIEIIDTDTHTKIGQIDTGESISDMEFAPALD